MTKITNATRTTHRGRQGFLAGNLIFFVDKSRVFCCGTTISSISPTTNVISQIKQIFTSIDHPHGQATVASRGAERGCNCARVGLVCLTPVITSVVDKCPSNSVTIVVSRIISLLSRLPDPFLIQSESDSLAQK
ncbi:uncharacterized protein HKW66_Vig0001200 [Vigna angularis]|uniref:Uncharacterized protein n=1 Tax=Phaseolus angularis TaxID=3914 RepID=A0A8T0LH51_PHAAN|nr:uncharacterized protein HKW66_Vig0001200 [Vigna angularis]